MYQSGNVFELKFVTSKLLPESTVHKFCYSVAWRWDCHRTCNKPFL